MTPWYDLTHNAYTNAEGSGSGLGSMAVELTKQSPIIALVNCMAISMNLDLL